MNELLGIVALCFGFFTMAAFISSILLTTLITVLEKKKIKDISDESFGKYFMIIQTIYNIIVIIVYLKKGST